MPGGIRQKFIVVFLRVVLDVEQVFGVPEHHPEGFLSFHPTGETQEQKEYCHPERSEGSRKHPLDASEILRHYVPLNDIHLLITSAEHLPTHPANASRTYRLPEYAYVRLESGHHAK